MLVVEDDDTLRQVACESLNDAGWATEGAPDAQVAMETLEHGSAFDAVFTDVDMPGATNGLALAAAVRARWPTVDLVVTSGRYAVDAGQVPVGAVFLSKPYQRRQLLAVLELVCGVARRVER